MKMTPSLSIQNSTDSALMDVHFFSDVLLRSARRPLVVDPLNEFVGEFRVSVKLAMQAFKSLLRLPVIHIVLMSAKKQMLRLTAPLVVATVADHKPGRDVSECELPRESVRVLNDATELDVSVTELGGETSPNQAVSVLDQFGIKPWTGIVPAVLKSSPRRLFGLLNAKMVVLRAGSFIRRSRTMNAAHVHTIRVRLARHNKKERR